MLYRDLQLGVQSVQPGPALAKLTIEGYGHPDTVLGSFRQRNDGSQSRHH